MPRHRAWGHAAVLCIPCRLLALGASPVCYEHHAREEFQALSGGCPQECLYKSSCNKTGSVQCVQEADCPQLHSGGIAVAGTSVSQEAKCVGCNIVGCKTCESQDRCKVCKDNFEFLNGGKVCRFNRNVLWYGILPVSGFFVSWFIFDSVRAACRQTTNGQAIEAGLKHRFHVRVRQNNAGHDLYPLTTNMHTTDILGPDLALFMNWFWLVAIVALYLMVLSLIFKPDVQVTGVEDICVHLSGNRRFSALLNHSNPARVLTSLHAEYKPIQIPMVQWWTGLSYAGSVLISYIFFVLQQRNMHQLFSQEGAYPKLHHFAVELRGFPPDATDHAEIHRYISDSLKKAMCLNALETVSEISICYDFAKAEGQVAALLEAHLIHQQQQHEKLLRNGDATAIRKTKLAMDFKFNAGEQNLLRKHTKKFKDERSRSADSTCLGSQNTLPAPLKSRPGPLMVQLLAYIILGTSVEWGPLKLKGFNTPWLLPSPQDTELLLNSLRNSGTIVVVMRTELLMHALLATRWMPVKFRDTHAIKVADLLEEPCSMQWVSYTSSGSFCFKIVISALIICVVLVIWTLLYGPYAYFMTTAFPDASSAASLVNQLMGAGVALGNAVVAQTVIFITDYLAFHHESTKRLVQLLVVVPCVMINVMCDIAVYAGIAYFKYSDVLPHSVNFYMSYLAMLIQNELYGMLVPGYVIVPYIGEPIATVVLPFWIAIWRVKGDPRITPHRAERLLVASEIDIVNPPFCDLVVISATFAFTLFAPAWYHWQLFGAMLIFAVFTYTINRYRILRIQSCTSFTTTSLHQCECYLWGLPLAILAATFGARLGDSMDHRIANGLFGFVVHCLLHLVFVRYVLPTFHKPRRPRTATYEEVVARAPATYRNTNPIEVLKTGSERCLWAAEHGFPEKKHNSEGGLLAPWIHSELVYYRRGQEHLQPSALEKVSARFDHTKNSGMRDLKPEDKIVCTGRAMNCSFTNLFGHPLATAGHKKISRIMDKE